MGWREVFGEQLYELIAAFVIAVAAVVILLNTRLEALRPGHGRATFGGRGTRLNISLLDVHC